MINVLDGVFVVVLVGALEVLLGLLGVADDGVQDVPDEPQLRRVLLGHRVHYVVYLRQSFLVVLEHEQVEDGVEGVLVDVQTAEAHVGQVGLGAVGGLVVLHVFLVRVLVLGVEHLGGVHDGGTLLEVGERLVVVSGVEVHHSSVQVVVLLVEYVLFVVVGFLVLLVLGLELGLFGHGGGVFQFLPAVDLVQFPVVQLGEVLVLVLHFLLFLVGDAEAEVVLLDVAVALGELSENLAVLLAPALDGSDLVRFGALGAGDDLRVVVGDGGVVVDLGEVLVLLIRDQLSQHVCALFVCLTLVALGRSLLGAGRGLTQGCQAFFICDCYFIVGRRLNDFSQVFQRILHVIKSHLASRALI